MNYPLDICIMNVVSEIPPQILDLAVRRSNMRFHEDNNLTEWICKRIIENRVLKDVNLVAGQVKTIVLLPAWLEYLPSEHGGYAGDDGPNTVYRIPPEARDGKPISQVMTLQFPYITYQSSGIANADVASGGFSFVDQVDQVINSYNLATPRNHPVVRLLAGDIVQIVPSQYTRQHWLLTCRINYDETFNNMHESSILTLSDMTVAATKHWIYTNLIVDVDRAVQETGMDLPTIRSIIEEYKDGSQQYRDARMMFRGTSTMDPETRRRLYFFSL